MVMVCQVKVYKASWNFKNKGTTTKKKKKEARGEQTCPKRKKNNKTPYFQTLYFFISYSF
jgi:hypothetical protein